MSEISADSLMVSRANGLLEAEVDGEMVGLHVDNGTCYGFNGTAYRIWQLIEQPKTVAALCAVLVEEFEIDAVTCETDVREVLQDLSQDGLVTLSAA